MTAAPLIHFERDGTSAHLWIGPFGIHIWRHRSTFERGLIHLAWCKDWRS